MPWLDLDPVLNLDGELLARGFSYDLVTRGTAALAFTVETYPGLKKLLEEDPDFLQSLMEFELLDLAFQFHILATATAMSADEFVGYQRQRAEEMRWRFSRTLQRRVTQDTGEQFPDFRRSVPCCSDRSGCVALRR